MDVSPYMKMFLILGTITAGGLVFYGIILPYEKSPTFFAVLIILGYGAIGAPILVSRHYDKKEIKA